jgi:predicted nucleic acid-binding protein
MPGGDFLDANTILYLFSSDDRKRHIAEVLVDASIVAGAAISFQVVQEVLNVVSQKVRPVPTAVEISALFDDVFAPLWRVLPSRSLYERAMELHGRYQYSFYDSLIIAAALEAGCDRLLTEDMQHGQRIEGLVIENPFRDI